MGIYEQVNDQIKESMRAREAARTAALRNIRAGFIDLMKQDNSQTLTDEQCVSVIRRLAKQRQESIEAYKAGAREDLVAAETAELAVLEGFLPKLASADVTRVWVQGAIAATGATSVKDLGKIMAHLKGAHKDDLDGKLAQVLVKEMLG